MVLRLLDSCGICHLWNTPPGYSFSGYFFSSLYFSFLLTVVSVSNTQCINSTSSWVYDHTSAIPVVPMSQDGSTINRSDLPAGGQEELGGVGHSERMMADMMKMLANLTIQNQQLLQQHLQQ